jgi:hypothetical protein
MVENYAQLFVHFNHLKMAVFDARYSLASRLEQFELPQPGER